MIKSVKNIFTASLFLIILFSTLTTYAEDETFIIMIDETYDSGKIPPGEGAAELYIADKLIEKEYNVADQEMVLSIRESIAPSDLLKGKVPSSVSALEADFIIVGNVKCSVFSNESMGVPVKSSQCNMRIKVLRVDTGQFILTHSDTASGMDNSADTASMKAAKKLAKRFLKKKLNKIKKRSKKTAVTAFWIYDLNDRAVLDELTTSLKSIPDVQKVKTKFFSKEVTKLEIKLKKGDGLSLSGEIQKNRDLAFVIEQVSNAVIKVRYDLSKVVDINVYINLINNKTRLKRNNWLENSIAETFSSSLSNSRYLNVVTDLDSSKQNSKSSDKAGFNLISKGSIKGKGNKTTLTISLIETAGKQNILSYSETGDEENITDLVVSIADKFNKNLLQRLVELDSKGRLVASIPKLSKLSSSVKTIENARHIKIDNVEVQPIFPALYARYIKNPLGNVYIINKSNKSASDVVISVEIPGYTKLPHEKRLKEFKGGQKLTVPLNLSLDKNSIFTIDENTPAQMKISVSYTSGERELKDTFIKPVLFYDRNAIDWKMDGSISAFLTPRDEIVKNFSRKAITEPINEQIPKGLRFPMAIFNALTNLPIKYVKDPLNPFGEYSLDFVQYPRETLNYKTGDCDDVSVLYASMLESVGISTMFLLTPAHILVAFNTGLSKAEVMQITPDDSLYMLIDGKAWIPVEATKMDKSFIEAWYEGAREIDLKSSKKNIEAVNIREAWKSYPAVSLSNKIAAIKNLRVNEKKYNNKIKADLKKLTRDNKKYISGLLKKYKRESNKNIKGNNNYSRVLAETNQINKAEKAALKGLKKFKHNPLVNNNLANILLLQGKTGDSVAVYEKVYNKVKENDQKALVASNLAVVNFVIGAEKDSLKWMKECLKYGGESELRQMGLTFYENDSLRGDEKDKKNKLKKDLSNLLDSVRKEIPKKNDAKNFRQKKSITGGKRGTDSSDKVSRNKAEILELLNSVTKEANLLSIKTDDTLKKKKTILGGRRGAEAKKDTKKELYQKDLMILLLQAQGELPEKLNDYGYKRKSPLGGRRGADPSVTTSIKHLLRWF